LGIPGHKLWKVTYFLDSANNYPFWCLCVCVWSSCFLKLNNPMTNWFGTWKFSSTWVSKILHGYDFIPEWMPPYLQNFVHIFIANESLLLMHNINFVSWSTLHKELYRIMLQNKSDKPALKLETSFLIILFKLS